MKTIILAAVAALCLTGCKSDEAVNIEAVQQAVREKLRDPESARFTNVVMRANYVCGSVNGKNGFGGYAGAERFYGLPGTPKTGDVPAFVTLESDPLFAVGGFDEAYKEACGS